MKIIYSPYTANIEPCVATVGFFDGVHAGHRFLTEELKAIAKEQNYKSMIITFATHPRKVIDPHFQPEQLNTLDEKLQLLSSTGVDYCIVLDFDIEMAKLSAYEFLKTILKEQFKVQTLLVGHDHRFGHNRAEGFKDYLKYGTELNMKVIQATRYKTDTDNQISSSNIRTALQSGDIEKANRILTYPYSLIGKVITGYQVGHKIGFPTANIKPENAEKIIPALGVYEVWVKWNSQQFKGMMNIGKRPTLNNGVNISIEVHIIDFNTDIYNQDIEVAFIRKIRDEKKFNNIDELIIQLKLDKQNIIEMN